jgi:hypothetical protein
VAAAISNSVAVINIQAAEEKEEVKHYNQTFKCEIALKHKMTTKKEKKTR